MNIQKIKDGLTLWIWAWLGFVTIISITGIAYAAFNSLSSDKVSGDTLLSSEWNQLINNQNDLKNSIDNFVDTDTQLNEAQVDAYVSNNGFITEDTQLTEAEVDAYVSNNGFITWAVDTTLSESEVDAFVSNNGYISTIWSWSNYIRLWNIQIARWVSWVISSGTNQVITFPQAFSSVPSVMVSTTYRTGYLCSTWSSGTDNRTTTGFTMKIESWASNKCPWIAIGPWQ